MKIAHVTPYDLAIRGGVNASVVELVRRQSARGHDVTLIGGASARRDLPNWLRLDAIVVSIPVNGSVAPLAIPTSGGPDSELERLLLREAFDALVVHEPALPLGMALLSVSKSANVGVFHAYSESIGNVARVVGTFTPTFTLGWFSPWLTTLHRRVAVSTAAREFAATYLPGAYEVIPNGIDVPARIERAPDTATILFLGRPEPRKGLDVLLRAMPHVVRDAPRARLVIAGDGTDAHWAPYRARASALGVAGATEFLGRVSEERKRELFARATAYTSPAIGGESQGVVLLESMALGAPVVASDIAGYRTVVTSGVDGLLVTREDPRTLADALLRVVRDRDLARRLSSTARAMVQRRYDWRVVVPQHLAVYEDAAHAIGPTEAIA